MEPFFRLIYWLTTSLLLPVIAGLVGLMAAAAFHAGSLVGSWRRRRRMTPADRWTEWMTANVHVGTLAGGGLDAVELEMTCRLTRLRWGVRVAPMLGLMGTLIPLGPALSEFSSGDVKAASAQVVIAFGTTVMGLASAVVYYTVWQVYRIWYAADLLELEQATDAQAPTTVADEAECAPAPTTKMG